MKISIRKHLSGLLPLACMSLFCSCGGWRNPAVHSDKMPPIYPDYIGVTVPSNIAPLNFMVEDSERIQATICLDGEELARVAGKEGVISMDENDWSNVLKHAAGRTIDVHVSVWSSQCPDGQSYASFPVNVAHEPVDEWVAYRLIEPGYRSWRQVGLYQRSLSSFDERAIVTNATENETCLNCHHFPAYSSKSIMFHARGGDGGTILYHNGKLTKIKFNEIGPKKNTTYPAWHPEGRFIAFSSNTTRQTFYLHGKKPIEVYDNESDLLVYDTMTGEVIADERFMTAHTLETFPAWSPDGRYLYYAAADAKKLPDQIEDMHYHLLRISFDKESGHFGNQIDTVYNAFSQGGSASHPRVSADGNYLLYTWTEYGTFPVWHQEADLRMLNLQTNEPVDVSIWNAEDEADSYHSWASDGRWVIYGSRRQDGRYTHLYIGYFDRDGRAHKPFLLPQEDPRYNHWRLKSYNVPEFVDGIVDLPDEVVKLFDPEN